MSDNASLEQTMVSILFDPHIRDACSVYIKPWMFTKKIYEYLIATLLGPQFTGKYINKNLLLAAMKTTYNIKEEMNGNDWIIIERLIDDFTPVPENDFKPAVSIIQTFIKDRLQQKGTDLFARGRKVEAEEFFVSASLLQIAHNPFVNPLEEGIMDKLWAKDMPTGGKVIQSSLGIINTSLMYGGYKKGDLGMVCLRPKGGKSMMMVQEAASATQQEFNVAHLFFGDMSEFDGICMYCANITGDPLIKVVRNYNEYKKRCERWLDHLRIASFPAMYMDCYETVSHIKRLKRQFAIDMCILDYDLNIRATKEAPGMYEGGGLTYSVFKGAASSEGYACLIGSQTKQQFWDMEKPPGEAAAESSRKQQTIDIMINGGRNSEVESVGTFWLPYVRRGISGEITRVRFDDDCRRIQDITSREYERLLTEGKSKKKGINDTSVLDGIKFEDRYKEEAA
jgi:hypothetical protein